MNEDGQALTEYIVMIAIIVGFYVAVATGISKLGIERKLSLTLKGPFAAAYRYGHVKAKGFDDGGPENHPRASGGNNNFRLFLNPRIQ